MKIRSGLFAPSIATLTVVAILATGFVLGQLQNGLPSVALLGLMQQSAAAAKPATAAVEPASGILAYPAVSGDGAGPPQQPNAQQAAADVPVKAPGSAAQHTKVPVAVPVPGVSGDSADSDDSQVDGEQPAPSSPQSDATGEGTDLGAPLGGSTPSTGALGVALGRDTTTTPATRPSVDSTAQDGPAVLLATALDDVEQTESAPHEVDEED